MADKTKVTEQYYAPLPDPGKSFRIFLWNSETGEFLGRTGSNWAKFLLFYLIFYAILVGFFAAMLAIFYQTLDSKMPKWQVDASLIGSNPGMSVNPSSLFTIDSYVIQYNPNNKLSVLKWTTNIDNFIDEYRHDKGAGNRVSCSPTTGPLEEDQVCDVPIETFYPCTPENYYNYEKGRPCVFLRLNRIVNWIPKVYNTTEDLPANIPEDLKQHIRIISGNPEANTVWVSCEGVNPADVENIGPIQYIPRRGFPSYYYPFTNKEGYLSPLVAVLFEKPRKGVPINIVCKAWAKNIFHDRYERRGLVNFQLMVACSEN